MTSRSRYIDLELTAWVYSRNGDLRGVGSVRARAAKAWSRLTVAQRTALAPTVDALQAAMTTVDTLVSAGLPAVEVRDNNSVAAFSAVASALIAARQASSQAMGNYLALRSLYPKAQFAELWLGICQVDEDFAVIAEQAELVRIVAARTAGGLLGIEWIDRGVTGHGGNPKPIRTFVKVDMANQVVDRIVVKDETEMFDFDSVWDSVTIPGRDLPTEITTMLRARSRIGSETIVKLRNWRVEDGTGLPLGRPSKFRAYLECCGRGDLSDITNVVPEPFMWKVLEDLVKACVILDRGDVDPGGAAWVPIIHRDIKLENVFLTDPGQSFCRYPTAKLGDFGPSMFLAVNDLRTFDQLNHREVGTPSYRPPEQLNSTLTGSAAVHPMSTKSNVWGIGLLMWSLVQRTGGDPNLERPDEMGFAAGNLKPYAFNNQAAIDYSADLLSLIMDCVEYLPDNRPTLYEVQRRVRLGIAAHTQGLQNANRNDPSWTNLMPTLPAEKWAMTGPAAFDANEDLGGAPGTIMIFPV